MQKDNFDFLLTGASGFLGSVIMNELSHRGFAVGRLGRNTEFEYKYDLSDTNISISVGAKTVIHCAGKAHSIPKTHVEEQEFFNVNYEGTKNLCDALVRSSVLPEAFIFVSSVSVYGLDSGELIDENHPLNGATPYAKSKILAEKYLTAWADKYGINLVILRLPLVAGKDAPGNLGAMISGISKGRYFSIGDASARKSIVWAEDIANLMISVAGKRGIYNLTDGHNPSFKELEKAISSAIGKNPPKALPIFIARALGKVGDLFGNKFPINSEKLSKITSTLTFDDTKAKDEIHWIPTAVLSQVKSLID